MRILLFALFLSPLSQAAALPKDYVNSLATVYETINAARQTGEICRSLYPVLRPANDAAWRSWQTQHRPLLTEFEGRYQGYIRGLADNDQKRQATYLKIMHGKFEQKKAVRRAEIKKLGATKSRAMCQNYPTLLENTLNPDKAARKEILLARRLRPVF